MKSSIKPRNLILRCYAEEGDDSWFAICLDLNLYARGNSFQEVRYKLNCLVTSYLKDAIEKDAEYIGDLIPRRAPLYFWLRYAFAKGINSIHRFASMQNFKLPLPLIPAN